MSDASKKKRKYKVKHNEVMRRQKTEGEIGRENEIIARKREKQIRDK